MLAFLCEERVEKREGERERERERERDNRELGKCKFSLQLKESKNHCTALNKKAKANALNHTANLLAKKSYRTRSDHIHNQQTVRL